MSHGVTSPMIVAPGSDHLLTTLGQQSVGYVMKGTNDPKSTFTKLDKGEHWFTMQFQLSVGENIHGLGERFGPFIKNGQSMEIWNENGGTSSEQAYKNVLFFLSSHRYGIFVLYPGLVSFEVQSERMTRVNIAVPSELLSMYIIQGPLPKDIIQQYTLLMGLLALPPVWSFGLWLSMSFTTDYNKTTVNLFLEGMDKWDISVDVFHYDCFWQKAFHWCDYIFDEVYFLDPGAQLARLKAQGYHISGVTNGYFIQKSDSSVWQTNFWQAGMANIDFTNPAACEWYQAKLEALIDLGIDCFKTNFAE
ncbi:Alpha-xylosidase [Termitomyces sp. T112]|nr:Alpha-xylosidase [Termitomyces sp. T112]